MYRYDLTRHDPDYEHITWGKLGKLINYFDMTPVMAQIEAGKYEQARATIESMYSHQPVRPQTSACPTWRRRSTTPAT